MSDAYYGRPINQFKPRGVECTYKIPLVDNADRSSVDVIDEENDDNDEIEWNFNQNKDLSDFSPGVTE